MDRRSEDRPTGLIHATRCGTWHVPKRHAAPAMDSGDDAMAAYLAAIAPAYAGLSRTTGQLGSLLLLSMHRGAHGLHLDHPLFGLAWDRMSDIDDILAATRVPCAASRHFRLITEILATLRQVTQRIAQAPAAWTLDLGKHEVKELIRTLHFVQDLLRATAVPEAGLSTARLDDTCCSCAASRRLISDEQARDAN